MANLSNINDKFLVTTTGNVLIGQTAVVGPSKLQVEGSTNAIIRMNSTAGTGGRMDFVHSGSNYGNIGSARNLLGTGNASDMMVNAGSLLILGVGSQDMTILPSGNVGIGAINPSSKFQVEGAPANGVYLSYLYNSATHNSANGLNIQTSSNNILTYGLRVNTAGDSNALAVMGNGNVGIGTASPAEKLQVKGSLCLNSESTSTGDGTELDSLLFKKSHPNGVSGYYTQGIIKGVTYGGYAGGMNFYYNRSANDGSGGYTPTQALWLNQYGNLCIGENSASYKFRVKSGTIALNSVSNGVYISAGTSSSNHALYVEKEDGTAEWFAVRGDGEIRLNATNGHTYAAQGIRFGGTGSSHELDYYQSGSWTPSVTSSGGGGFPAYASVGYFQRVGKVVTASFEFTISNLGTASGTVIINNLPIAIANGNGVKTVVGYGNIAALGQSLSIYHYTALNQIGMNKYDGSFAGTTNTTRGTVTYWAEL